MCTEKIYTVSSFIFLCTVYRLRVYESDFMDNAQANRKAGDSTQKRGMINDPRDRMALPGLIPFQNESWTLPMPEALSLPMRRSRLSGVAKKHKNKGEKRTLLHPGAHQNKQDAGKN